MTEKTNATAPAPTVATDELKGALENSGELSAEELANVVGGDSNTTSTTTNNPPPPPVFLKIKIDQVFVTTSQ